MAASTKTLKSVKKKAKMKAKDIKNSDKSPVLSNSNKSTVESHHTSSLMMLGSQLLTMGKFNSNLPDFVTRGVDAEQIWQQLELRNESKSTITSCTRNAARIQTRQDLRKKQTKKAKKIQKSQSIPKDTVESDDASDSNSDFGSDDNDDILNSIKKRLANDDNDDDDQDLIKSLDALEEEGNDDDLDFDFKVDDEMMKGLSDDDHHDEDNTLNKGKNSKRKNEKAKRKTVVDDKFFKLADMEEFLDIEDKKEEKRLKSEEKSKDKSGIDQSSDEDDEDEESDEEDIDMFEEDNDDDGNIKYADFFDPPYVDSNKKTKKSKENDDEDSSEENVSDKDSVGNENSDEEKEDDLLENGSIASEDFDDEKDESDEDNNGDDSDESQEETEEGDKDISLESVTNQKDGNDNSKQKKGVSFSSDLLQSDDDEDETELQEESGNKSTFERKQEELSSKAREMEELSLAAAPWELRGEATAGKRPENSLLETHLDFQHTSKTAPAITDETTKSLEDYIKQRIKDKTFDDVERKTKPTEEAFEFKKRIVLDQEKSKQSLGEIYEQEFLKQQQQDTEEVKADPECEKIEKQLDKLFHQLDALSNFRYNPMKPGTEVKIMVNTPAISMEEVAPTATTDAELLAPEEVYEKKRGEIKGADERDATDKKRALRQKKKDKRQRKKAKESREKAVQKLNPGLGNKHSKAKALKELEKQAKADRSVTMIEGKKEGQKLGSSTAFFSQLQDEVTTGVKAKQMASKAKKARLDPSRLML